MKTKITSTLPSLLFLPPANLKLAVFKSRTSCIFFNSFFFFAIFAGTLSLHITPAASVTSQSEDPHPEKMHWDMDCSSPSQTTSSIQYFPGNKILTNRYTFTINLLVICYSNNTCMLANRIGWQEVPPVAMTGSAVVGVLTVKWGARFDNKRLKSGKPDSPTFFFTAKLFKIWYFINQINCKLS